jgi:hypothetical protein
LKFFGEITIIDKHNKDNTIVIVTSTTFKNDFIGIGFN